jgi:hypothetical protein
MYQSAERHITERMMIQSASKGASITRFQEMWKERLRGEDNARLIVANHSTVQSSTGTAASDSSVTELAQP